MIILPQKLIRVDNNCIIPAFLLYRIEKMLKFAH